MATGERDSDPNRTVADETATTPQAGTARVEKLEKPWDSQPASEGWNDVTDARPQGWNDVTDARPALPTIQPPALGEPATPFDNEATKVRAISSPDDPLIGQMLGEYRVLSRLGEGGMGLVYRGEQPVIGRAVAIKVLRKEFAADPNHARRFADEARAVSVARHPGIIDIFTFGNLPSGEPYLVMELLEGQPLDQLLLENGRMTVAQVIDLLLPVLSALSAAHTAGIIHRDLKPANIFVVKLQDGTTFPKLLDFGLARRGVAGGKRVDQTSIGGTPLYIAPEQARGEPVSPQTDLYSLGCVIYELLIGRPPFFEGSLHVLLDAHASLAPLPLRALRAELPRSIERLVEELLAKDPADRPASALDVRARLEAIKSSGPRGLAEIITEPEREAVKRTVLSMANSQSAEEVSVSGKRRAEGRKATGDQELSVSGKRRAGRVPVATVIDPAPVPTQASTAALDSVETLDPDAGVSVSAAAAQPDKRDTDPARLEGEKKPWALWLGIAVVALLAGLLVRALMPGEDPGPRPPVPVPEPVKVKPPKVEPVPDVPPQVDAPVDPTTAEPKQLGPVLPPVGPVPPVAPKSKHTREDVERRWKKLRARSRELPSDLRRAAHQMLNDAKDCSAPPEKCWRELTDIEMLFFTKGKQ
ncbi:MAG: serine/threonine-protein kinase [Myxococcaceae bacterium]